MQIRRRELPKLLREGRIDDQGRVGDRVGDARLPLPARHRIGSAIDELHGLHDDVAVGAGAHTDIAVAQLPVAGVEIDAMEGLLGYRLELAPPSGAAKAGQLLGIDAKLYFDLLMRRHCDRCSAADLAGSLSAV